MTGPDNAPGTVGTFGVVGGVVGPVPLLAVVVVEGSVVVDVVVGTVTIVRGVVDASNADVTMSATNTTVSADRSGQFVLLSRCRIGRVAAFDPPPPASCCC